MANESQFNAAISLLTEAVRAMKPVTVPPPKPYDENSYHSIEDFIYFFERFCVATYGNDSISWLQVLPEFLRGESKCIVESFGRCKQTSYETVKHRLLKTCQLRDIGDDHYSRFFKTKRLDGESLVCYCIRLEVMASKIPLLDSVSRDALVRGNLCKSLADHVARNLNIQIGYLNSVSNDTLVTIASALEAQLGKIIPELPQIAACANICLQVTNEKPRAKRLKCYRCGLRGHIKRNCRVKLHERKVPKPCGKRPGNVDIGKGIDCNPFRKSVKTTLQKKYPKRSNKCFPSGKNNRIYEGSVSTSSSDKDWKNKPRSSTGAKEYFVPNCDVELPEIPKLPNSNVDAVVANPISTHPEENGLFNCSGPIPNLCFPGNISDPYPITQINLDMHEGIPCEHDSQIDMDWDMEATDGILNDSFLSSFNLDGIFDSDGIDVREQNESGYSSSDSCISVSCSEQKIESKLPKFSDGFDCSLLSFGNISYYEFPLNQNV